MNHPQMKVFTFPQYPANWHDFDMSCLPEVCNILPEQIVHPPTRKPNLDETENPEVRNERIYR